MNKDLYVLKFHPILKEKVWGGNKLKKVLNKNSKTDKTGESWEISDVEGDLSVVSDGPLAGKTLKSLIGEYKGDLVGEKVYKEHNTKFPLLIKFIDAAEALSIQLHPNDEVAQKRHNSFGKTEMWYIMQADEDAEIILGFKEAVTKSEYQALVEKGGLAEALNTEKSKPGDAYFIKAGLVHAIGAGILLAEIQQNSDITYRIYDWDRVSNTGEQRELHTQEALDCINLDNNKDFLVNYKLEENQKNALVHDTYFKTDILKVNGEFARNYEKLDSFVILMGVEGDSVIEYDEKSIDLGYGESLLIPACINKINVLGKNSKILEVSV
ncbi:mannose-6-phosphate isomerase, type 1 [Gillisia sp. Hel1_33_143]|uniref:type I phosphomannose isomerase catalytic subunit n=1 Tax=unclassified Gillisia TaxID=2615025 RepID=UPI000554993F|nr:MULTISPECIES: type I phosphomannose isomerase catalytic subunit [unclassified Gillisia]SDS29530.1 mannose-6-phosphate isomerase, type 1 [Gillisia sp. Hel1_33_143]